MDNILSRDDNESAASGLDLELSVSMQPLSPNKANAGAAQPAPIFIVMTHTCDSNSTINPLSDTSAMFDFPTDAVGHTEDLVRQQPTQGCEDIEEYLQEMVWQFFKSGDREAVGARYHYLAADGKRRNVWIAGEL